MIIFFIKILLFISFVLLNGIFTKTNVILRSKEDIKSSFDFNVKLTTFSYIEGRYYICSDENTDHDFALSANKRESQIIINLAPKLADVNNQKQKNNPIFGKAINNITTMGLYACITNNNVNSIYAVTDKMEPGVISVFQSDPLNDANGNLVKSISSITSTEDSIITPIDNIFYPSTLFASLIDQEDNLTGITFLRLGKLSDIKMLTVDNSDKLKVLESSKDDLIDKKKNNNIDINNKDNQLLEDNNFEVENIQWYTFNCQTGEFGNKAIEISKSSEFLAINYPLSKIENYSDLYFDQKLKRLYIAFKVESGDNQKSGCKAIAIGKIENNKLVIESIAPSSAFDFNNHIVGQLGSNVKIGFDFVRIMHTTTGFSYLIVADKSSVYAMPIINNPNSNFHGKLANVNSNIISFYSQVLQRFQFRSFQDLAVSSNQLYTINNSQALVGNNYMLPGNISKIVVLRDSVIVSTSGVNGGIFYSQSIFDKNGKIVSWSKWKRLSGFISDTSNFSFDSYSGSFLYIPFNNGITNSVFKTIWSNGDSDFELFLSNQFPSNIFGVQGFQQFDNNVLGNISLNVFTGYNKILLLQSSLSQNFDNTIHTILNKNSYKKLFESLDGSLNGFVNDKYKSISFSNGSILDISPIGSSEIIYNKENGWLICGGSKGIAILADKNGYGFDRNVGLGDNFSGLNDKMYFHKLGKFKNIRKLLFYNRYLYILSIDKLERIKINKNFNLNIKNNTIKSEILYKVKNDLNSLSDFLISKNNLLLASSIGLLKTDMNNIKWDLININESTGPITRIYSIGDESNRYENIYVLNGFVSGCQAQVYRFSISDNSFNQIEDQYVKGVNTFFINFGDYRNFFFTDGAFIAASRSKYLNSNGFLEIISPNFNAGQRLFNSNRLKLFFNKFKPGFNRFETDEAYTVNQLVLSKDSGSLIVTGSFGIRYNG